MFLVKTRVGQSKIHGLGCFAEQNIKAGAKIWEFKPGLDVVMTKVQLKKLPPPPLKIFLKYCYQNFKNKKFVLPFDDARFCNHSTSPTVKSVFPKNSIFDIGIATRDIKIGDELTFDYKQSDADYRYKLKK